ncbi:MAG: hypothetical protein R3304_00890 [Longimicrobiales bacterium]|nr:hypothetical protein [Longimicrobiales bacterium]
MTTKTTLFGGALFIGLMTTGCASDVPPEASGQSGPETRPSYQIRLDSESSDPSAFEVVEDDDGIRVQTGPAGIVWRPGDTISSGNMQVQATFRQFGAPVGYREAYGIFVGGIDLDGPELEYTYLLVRPTGDFLVKRRIGAITETLVDWEPHPSVHTVRAEGDEPINVLSIDVFEGETHFVVNGDVVHVQSASRIRPYGTAGVRVNHRLDVRVDQWLMRRTSQGTE